MWIWASTMINLGWNALAQLDPQAIFGMPLGWEFLRLLCDGRNPKKCEEEELLQNCSKNTWGFPEIGVPPIIHLDGYFPYKPSFLGYPHLWNPPYTKLKTTNNITPNLDFKGPDQWLLHWAPNPALYQAALVIRKTLKSCRPRMDITLGGFTRVVVIMFLSTKKWIY